MGMDAVFKAGGDMSVLLIALAVLGGVIVLGGLIGLLMNRKKRCYACDEKIPARARTCPYCGTSLSGNQYE
jgi:rRNA maturation endonuclease Nob1